MNPFDSNRVALLLAKKLPEVCKYNKNPVCLEKLCLYLELHSLKSYNRLKSKYI